MPLTAKGNKIMNAMKEEYGGEKGKQVFYASKNKGNISGVDAEAMDDDLESPAEMEEEKKLGAAAARKGAAGTDNPHMKGTSRWHAWKTGWSDETLAGQSGGHKGRIAGPTSPGRTGVQTDSELEEHKSGVGTGKKVMAEANVVSDKEAEDDDRLEHKHGVGSGKACEANVSVTGPSHVGRAADEKPIIFACDEICDRRGSIVGSFGSMLLIEGVAQDQGLWFTKGIGELGKPRKFQTDVEAMNYIQYALDAEPPPRSAGGQFEKDAVLEDPVPQRTLGGKPAAHTGLDQPEMKITRVGPWNVSQNPRTRQWETSSKEGSYVHRSEPEAHAFARAHPKGITGYDDEPAQLEDPVPQLALGGDPAATRGIDQPTRGKRSYLIEEDSEKGLVTKTLRTVDAFGGQSEVPNQPPLPGQAPPPPQPAAPPLKPKPQAPRENPQQKEFDAKIKHLQDAMNESGSPAQANVYRGQILDLLRQKKAGDWSGGSMGSGAGGFGSGLYGSNT